MRARANNCIIHDVGGAHLLYINALSLSEKSSLPARCGTGIRFIIAEKLKAFGNRRSIRSPTNNIFAIYYIYIHISTNQNEMQLKRKSLHGQRLLKRHVTDTASRLFRTSADCRGIFK